MRTRPVFLDIATEFKPSLRTDFSESESGRFSSGRVTTVLRLSSDESQVIRGPVNCSSFWDLKWAPKWDPVALIFWWVTLNTVFFFNEYNGPRPELYHRYIDDCFGATSSTMQRGTQWSITAVNLFHPALKCTWEFPDTSLAFLDTKFSSKATVYAPMCTTNPQIDSQSYLLHSTSHPSHIKNSIPYSQFLRLRRPCSQTWLFCPFCSSGSSLRQTN